MVLVCLNSIERWCTTARWVASAASTLALVACISLYGCASSLSGQATRTTTATPVLSTQGELSILAKQASGHVLGDIQVVYQPQAATALVTGTVSNAIPRTPTEISAAQEKVKTLCFQIQRELWTSSVSLGVPVQEVTVTILGPVFDDYFDQIISWYGTASLDAGAATQVDWRNLTVDAAWNRFQRTQLRVDFGSFQLYSTTPVPTTSSSPGGP